MGEHITDAVVVGHVDVGDSDRVIRLLTPRAGRVSVMARRARSSPGLGALLDVGNIVEVVWRSGRSDLGTWRDGKPLLIPNRARNDLDRIAALAYGCEVVGALAPEGGEAEKLFALLCSWVEALEEGTHVGSALRVALEAKALTFAGLYPTLDRCVRCGETVTAPCRMSLEHGGPAHLRCADGEDWSAELAPAVEVLRRTPLRAIADAEEAASLPTWALSSLVAWHATRPLRSRTLLEQLEDGG